MRAENTEGKPWWSKAIFSLAFLVFLTAQLYISYKTISVRNSPIEVDIAYGYILKARQMQSGCFLQDCKTLSDLRNQFTAPTTDLDTAFIRARDYHRVFVVYHPLHSLLLAGLNGLGFSYEKAYDFLSLAGKLVIAVGLTYWLVSIFKFQAASIALLLIAQIVFLPQGLQTAYPANLALGLGFFLWAILLNKDHRLRPILLPLTILMILTHTVGRIYGLLSLPIYYWMTEKPFSKQDKYYFAGTTSIIIASFILPMVVSHPELNYVSASFFPGEWNFGEVWKISLLGVYSHIDFWLAPFGDGLALSLLIVIGLFLIDPATKFKMALMGSCLLAFLIFSIIYIDPWFGALTFDRAWIPMALFLTGFIAVIMWKLAGIIHRASIDFLQTKTNKGRYPKLVRILAFSAVLLFFAWQLFTSYFPFYSYSYKTTLNYDINNQNYRFDASQPDLIADDNSTILYMTQLALYYYLSHPVLEHGALYYEAIDITQIDQPSVQAQLNQVTYLVTENPLYRLQENPDMSILLDDNAGLEFHAANQQPISSFQVFLQHEGRPIELNVIWQLGNQNVSENIVVPDDAEGWMEFVKNGVAANSVTISVVGERGLSIHGIRIGNDTTTNWSWDPGMILTLTPVQGDTRTVELTEESLIKMSNIRLEVLDDDGITILAKVLH